MDTPGLASSPRTDDQRAATEEAWSQILITTTTLGTDAVIEVNAIDGDLGMAVRVGYGDPGYTAITYDPVNHAYLRIREAAGDLLWETSPDGSTWTTRRTETAPAWVADTTLQVQLIAHRSDGTDDFAEYDDFNVVPAGGQTVAVWAARTAAGAGALGKAKTSGLGAARAAEAGTTVSGLATAHPGVARTAVAARGVQATKAAVVGTARDMAAGQTVAVRRAAPVSAAAESATARPVAAVRTVPVGAARTMVAGQLVAGRKTALVATAGVAADGRSLSWVRTAHPGRARQTAAARAVTATRSVPAGAGHAADSARP